MTAFYLLLLGLTIATVASQYVPGDGCCIRWNADGTCCINRFEQCCGDVTPFVEENFVAHRPVVVEENIVPAIPLVVDEVSGGQGGWYSGGRWNGGHWNGGRVVDHLARRHVFAHGWNGNKGHHGGANHH